MKLIEVEKLFDCFPGAFDLEVYDLKVNRWLKIEITFIANLVARGHGPSANAEYRAVAKIPEGVPPLTEKMKEYPMIFLGQGRDRYWRVVTELAEGGYFLDVESYDVWTRVYRLAIHDPREMLLIYADDPNAKRLHSIYTLYGIGTFGGIGE